MEYKIFLVEDDENLGFVIKDSLEDLKYRVDLFRDGAEALKSFFGTDYHLCILDIMLPKKDGFELATEIRNANSHIPLMFLTARSMKEDRIKGFKLGADDYITKPFSLEELELRVNVLIKRAYGTPEKIDSKFKIGDYVFDYDNLDLVCGLGKNRLTKKEGRLLRQLCINKNEVLKREKALEIIWGENDYFAGRSMDVYISKLRKYLKEDPKIKIENIHGVGFKLIVND
jgi:two-component system, OmpR family, response regulator